MFKKFFHIILVLTVVLLTSGVTITRHYCGDNLRSVALMTTPQACCDMEGCCHNETETIFIEDEFSPAGAIVVPSDSGIEFHRLLAETITLVDLPERGIIYSGYIEPPPMPSGRRLASLQVYIL